MWRSFGLGILGFPRTGRKRSFGHYEMEHVDNDVAVGVPSNVKKASKISGINTTIFPKATISYFNICFVLKQGVKFCSIDECRKQLFQGMLGTKKC